MLVLTRKLRESLIVGGGASAHRELTVTVLEILCDRVRLGIEAHHDVKVHRQEVWERIRQAAVPVPNSVVLRSVTNASFIPGLNGLDRVVDRAAAQDLRAIEATDL
jgi:carbon storage regulator